VLLVSSRAQQVLKEGVYFEHEQDAFSKVYLLISRDRGSVKVSLLVPEDASSAAIESAIRRAKRSLPTMAFEEEEYRSAFLPSTSAATEKESLRLGSEDGKPVLTEIIHVEDPVLHHDYDTYKNKYKPLLYRCAESGHASIMKVLLLPGDNGTPSEAYLAVLGALHATGKRKC